jgi:hypothetical protein
MRTFLLLLLLTAPVFAQDKVCFDGKCEEVPEGFRVIFIPEVMTGVLVEISFPDIRTPDLDGCGDDLVVSPGCEK